MFDRRTKQNTFAIVLSLCARWMAQRSVRNEKYNLIFWANNIPDSLHWECELFVLFYIFTRFYDIVMHFDSLLSCRKPFCGRQRAEWFLESRSVHDARRTEKMMYRSDEVQVLSRQLRQTANIELKSVHGIFDVNRNKITHALLPELLLLCFALACW